jgi:hypothetical protein
MSSRRAILAVLVLAFSSACSLGGGGEAPPPPKTVAVPRIPGMAAVALAGAADPGGSAEDRLGPPADGCQSGDPAVFVLAAEVDATSPGAESVLVSAAHGVVVLDARGARRGALPFTCGGSGDEILSVAVGDVGIGAPAIAVVAVTGGRAEATTRVELLALADGRLARLFAGDIEVRDGDELRTGELRVTPTGLVHRPPTGTTTRHRADPWTHRFTPEAAGDPPPAVVPPRT